MSKNYKPKKIKNKKPHPIVLWALKNFRKLLEQVGPRS